MKQLPRVGSAVLLVLGMIVLLNPSSTHAAAAPPQPVIVHDPEPGAGLSSAGSQEMHSMDLPDMQSMDSEQVGSVDSSGVDLESGPVRDMQTTDPQDVESLKAMDMESTASMEGMMLEPNRAAFVPVEGPISRAGWTVTASDAQATGPASRAIDGSTSTHWHSAYSPTLVKLPHWITIDMHAIRSVGGLTYLPRQDTSLNGTIGRFSISTSIDNKTWSSPVIAGTWADGHAKKTVTFSPVTTRFVRLTALTEAGNRGQWTSVADLNLLGAPLDLSVVPHDGWISTASDQLASHPATAAVDNNGGTFWHSATGVNGKPLPHSFTVDLGAARSVTATTGSTVNVTTSGNTSSFALVRTSAVTHSVNSDQRRIPLSPVTVDGSTYTLQIPADKGVALPGQYLLFALDENGTPSIAKYVSIR